MQIKQKNASHFSDDLFRQTVSILTISRFYVWNEHRDRFMHITFHSKDANIISLNRWLNLHRMRGKREGAEQQKNCFNARQEEKSRHRHTRSVFSWKGNA